MPKSKTTRPLRVRESVSGATTNNSKIYTFFKDWKHTILVLSVILFLALLLRLYNLNSLPVFGDEAIYIRWAQVMRADATLRFLPLADGKQPLFMWLVIPFQKVILDPLIAGRLVSVLAGLGTLIGIFILTYLLFKSKRLSIITVLLYAISPLSVFFDRMALVDPLLTFFGIWTLVFSLITVTKVRLDSAMLAGFAMGGALLTKSPGIFFAIFTPFSLILYKWPKSFKEKFNRASIFVFLFTFTYAIAFLLYNILRLGSNFHMIGIRNLDYIYPLSHVLASPLDPFKPFMIRIFEYIWLLGPGAVFLLFLAGVYFGLKEKRRETILLLLWAILPILVIAEYNRTMTARYIYLSIPYIYIISAFPLARFVKKRISEANIISPDWWGRFTPVATILLLIFIIQALFVDYKFLVNIQEAKLPRSERSGYLEEWTAGYGIKEVSELIRKEYLKNPQAKIVVGTEGFFGPLPDALQAYLADIPQITVIWVGLPIKDIPVQLIESKMTGNKTYLVVNNDRFLTESEGDLNLLAVWGKAVRPDGSRQTLLFFEITETALVGKQKS